MPDILVLFVLVWMTIGTGLLFYSRPRSIAAKRIRIVVLGAVFGSVVMLSLHSGIPMTSGEAYLSIGLPVIQHEYSDSGALPGSGPGRCVGDGGWS